MKEKFDHRNGIAIIGDIDPTRTLIHSEMMRASREIGIHICSAIPLDFKLKKEETVSNIKNLEMASVLAASMAMAEDSFGGYNGSSYESQPKAITKQEREKRKAKKKAAKEAKRKNR